MMTKQLPIRIAVAGLGEFGALHAATIAGLGEFELVALCDQDRLRAEQLGQRYPSVPVFTELGQLLNTARPDAVVIVTRTDTHVDYALQVLDAGAAVLVEKPAGRDLNDLLRLRQLPETLQKKWMVNHICLFHSLLEPLRNKVEQNNFRTLRFVRHRPGWMTARFAGETPLQMTMVHDLYVAAQFVDGEEPRTIDGWSSTNPQGATDMCWARMEWEDGRSMTFESFWTLPDGAAGDGCDSIEAFGEGYHARVDTNPAAFQWTDAQVQYPVALEISSVQGRPTGMLAEAYRSFAAVCRGQPVTPGCTLEDSIRVQRWVDRLAAGQ